MADGTMIPVTGLWLKKTRDGRPYFSGNLNRGCAVLIFKNDRKEKESDPDYRMYFAQAANDGDGGGRRNRDGGGGASGGGERRRRFNDRGGNGGGDSSPPGNANADDRDFS